jgi:hypothetical protein
MTYTWTVTNLIGYPLFDGQTDVVTTAFYTVVADDGQGHVAEYQNIQQIPLPTDRPFIPYADLTNDIVVGWIQDALGENGVDSIEANLDAQIETQINPPLTPQSLPLPWAPPASEPPAPDTSSPTA